ncbi:hypothetical protein ACIA5C_46015 [Actinoplanes sp. NPDC051343]|uniref:hypothetical protein n=1 Tax=Actinoplanes sp. NPDC051343 TaxID=3363906 RepID=UPI00379FA39A
MTTKEIIVAALLAIGAAELCDYLAWAAKKLARTAAYLRYGHTRRGKVRAEEWVTLIEERPDQFLKFGTALWLLITGFGHRLSRKRAELKRSAAAEAYIAQKRELHVFIDVARLTTSAAAAERARMVGDEATLRPQRITSKKGAFDSRPRLRPRLIQRSGTTPSTPDDSIFSD